jgi:hypothetical protein
VILREPEDEREERETEEVLLAEEDEDLGLEDDELILFEVVLRELPFDDVLILAVLLLFDVPLVMLLTRELVFRVFIFLG